MARRTFSSVIPRALICSSTINFLSLAKSPDDVGVQVVMNDRKAAKMKEYVVATRFTSFFYVVFGSLWAAPVLSAALLTSSAILGATALLKTPGMM